MLYQRIQAVFDDVKHYYYEMLDEYEYTEDYYQMNGEAVRYVRTVFDISRNKLANVIGTSPRTLGRFEDGVRTRLAVESILNGIEKIAIKRLVEEEKEIEEEVAKYPVRHSSLAARFRAHRSTHIA